MSVITFPDTLGVSRLQWSQRRHAIRHRSSFGSQTVESLAPVWQVLIERNALSAAEAGAWMSLFLRLRGGLNQLEFWNLGRPVPRGTLRGTLTLAADAARGAASIQISGGVGQAGATLLAGDFLGLGSGLTQQVVMVTVDATADASGLITVSFESPLRNAFTAGTAVTWDKPKALFRVQNDILGWEYEKAIVNGFALELLEDWRA